MYPAHFNELMELVKQKEPQIPEVRRLMENEHPHLTVLFAIQEAECAIARLGPRREVSPDPCYRLMADIARFLVDQGITEVDEKS